MRILHTSDWHIGRQFHSVSLLEDQRHVLQQIVDVAKSESADVVIVAGDIYDRAVPPAAAVSLVDEVFNQLINHLGIPVIAIAGNHDGPQRLGFASRQLAKANLYIAGPLQAEPQSIVLKDKHGDVVFYPIPYADPATVRGVYADHAIRTHNQGMEQIIQALPTHKKQRSVAIAHCFIAGGVDCDSERPLSVGGSDQVSPLHFKDFNYVAMGHLHRQQQQGVETVRYSGSPLKYSFSEEQHEKSITIVDLDAMGQCDIKHIPLNALRDMRSISGTLDDIIHGAKKDPNVNDYLLISLTDTHAILDPMGKLRAAYPNVLHLERPGLMAAKPQQLVHRDLMKKGELSMFKDFYKQTLDETLGGEQEKILSELLDGIHADREM